MATLTETAAPSAPATAKTASRRYVSVDALRGFDMFWIIGADSLVYALHRMSRNPVTDFLADQLDHAEWAGFHFYDLIFPLFVFIVGVSVVFSLSRQIEQGGRAAALRRVLVRTVMLFLLALFYSGGIARGWPDMRLMGVLNRIALAYGAAGVLFCFCRPRTLAAVTVALLVGYWAILAYVPIRDIQLSKETLAAAAARAGDAEGAAALSARTNPSGEKNSRAWAAAEKLYYGTHTYVTGRFEPGLNVTNHFDFEHLPGRKYDTFWDPEGFLSTFPAVATCLLGVFAGLLLRRTDVDDQRKVLVLLLAGAVAVALGWAWGVRFPVVKKIWASSFVLVAGGYSAWLLAAFYQLIEIWKFQRWCVPFVWMGMNSITVYVTANLLGGFRVVAQRVFGGDVRAFLDRTIAAGTGDLVIALAGLALAFWFVRFLYRRQVFLRV